MEFVMNNLKSEKYIHRNIWVDRCNDNYISNSYTYNIHLKSIADEINVEGAAAICNPPTNSMDKSWKKIEVR
jgi:hypothetical protein|tara:strand:- start:182 stop:397 length:216 start_codon:yes stop_codon:yes gene_type:complete